MVKLSRIGDLLKRRNPQIGVGVSLFILAAQPMLRGQDIARFTSSDGRRIFSNTEEIYKFVATPLPSGESRPDQRTPERVRSSFRILDLIDQIAGNHGVDPELVKVVAKVESNYNPRAVSHKGARGIMQLMPSTARRFGVANAFDPRQNIEGGVRYLKFLRGMFPENLSLVLAAYNAGENAVRKFRGVPPYQETQSYVRKITRLYGERPSQTSRQGLKADIVSYQDSTGRLVYSNVESAFQ